MEASLAYKTKKIVEKYGFSFKKNFGQNFLVDERVLGKIVSSAEISKDDVVIEVGPGIGTCLLYTSRVVVITACLQ